MTPKDKVTPRITGVSFDGTGFVLVLASMADGDAVLAFRLRNRQFLAPFEPLRDDSYYTPDGVARHLAQQAQMMAESRSVNWLIWDKDCHQVIGVINFSNIIAMPFNACYLGYSLDSAYQGRGVMSAALNLAIDEMFIKVGLHRIMTNYLPDNHKSAKVLARLGFAKEGYAKAYLQIAGQWQDHVLTALTNEAVLAIPTQ